jgi:hypothetical protein
MPVIYALVVIGCVAFGVVVAVDAFLYQRVRASPPSDRRRPLVAARGGLILSFALLLVDVLLVVWAVQSGALVRQRAGIVAIRYVVLGEVATFDTIVWWRAVKGAPPSRIIWASVAVVGLVTVGLVLYSIATQ